MSLHQEVLEIAQTPPCSARMSFRALWLSRTICLTKRISFYWVAGAKAVSLAIMPRVMEKVSITCL